MADICRNLNCLSRVPYDDTLKCMSAAGCTNRISHYVTVKFTINGLCYDYKARNGILNGAYVIVPGHDGNKLGVVVAKSATSDKATNFVDKVLSANEIGNKLAEIFDDIYNAQARKYQLNVQDAKLSDDTIFGVYTTPLHEQTTETEEKEKPMYLELLSKSKEDFVKAQTGAAVIDVIKRVIDKAPLTETQREFVEKSPYADALIGVLAEAAAVHFTRKPSVIKAVECARVVGITRMSENITFIRDIIGEIEKAITGAAKVLEDKDK